MDFFNITQRKGEISRLDAFDVRCGKSPLAASSTRVNSGARTAAFDSTFPVQQHSQALLVEIPWSQLLSGR